MNTVFLSEQAEPVMAEYLRKKGCCLKFVTGTKKAPPFLRCHPDLYLCKLGSRPESPVFQGDAENLDSTYPRDVIYNGVCTDHFFIHHLRCTDPLLLKTVKAMGRIPVSVRQGYTKCSCVVVPGDALITEDAGIAASLKDFPIEVLLVEKGFVSLPGYSAGFLGGASGGVGGEMLFHGDLSVHPNVSEITAFIREHHMEPVYFPQFPLRDIGSVIEAKSPLIETAPAVFLKDFVL